MEETSTKMGGRTLMRKFGYIDSPLQYTLQHEAHMTYQPPCSVCMCSLSSSSGLPSFLSASTLCLGTQIVTYSRVNLGKLDILTKS